MLGAEPEPGAAPEPELLEVADGDLDWCDSGSDEDEGYYSADDGAEELLHSSAGGGLQVCPHLAPS